ncbi:MAG: YkoF family thiamine/hydroxymethylpyrimidine-binding protein [Phycisphaerae bacterium]|nr:YkoF family thiamine/hydroxymethylpyrimidine-binding protein [Phycisphaerae bacterium]
MKVQAQVSVYSLKTKSLSEPIDEFCGILKDRGLKVETQTMSSLVTGESDIIFKSVQEAFEQLTQSYQIVMSMKISNACPRDKSK